MRTSSWWVIGLALALVSMGGGCQGPTQRLNAPPQGPSAKPSPLQDNFIFMLDNAMLEDLCLADVHFVPHTAAINGLGVRRLSRYSELLRDFGGTLHLETTSTDDELIEARLQNMHGFLASTGLDMTAVTIQTGLPRGRTTEAVEAIRIKREGTLNDYSSGVKSSGGSPGGAAMTAGAGTR